VSPGDKRTAYMMAIVAVIGQNGVTEGYAAAVQKQSGAANYPIAHIVSDCCMNQGHVTGIDYQHTAKRCLVAANSAVGNGDEPFGRDTAAPA
jgi:hypothetical protein